MKVYSSPAQICFLRLRVSLLTLILSSMLVLQGCSSDAPSEGRMTAEYPAGVSEDIEQQLKYDARVDTFEADGEDLVVEVNDSWATSPQGMQERAAGQWFTLWHPGHSGKVIVKHNGEVMATCSNDGYKPQKPASESEAGTQPEG